MVAGLGRRNLLFGKEGEKDEGEKDDADEEEEEEWLSAVAAHTAYASSSRRHLCRTYLYPAEGSKKPCSGLVGVGDMLGGMLYGILLLLLL